MADGTYAPQSPDLSSFFSSTTSPPQQQHPPHSHPQSLQPHQHQQQQQTSSYAPRSPNLSSFGPSSTASAYRPSSTQFSNFQSNTNTTTSRYQPPTQNNPLGHRTSNSYGIPAADAADGLGLSYDRPSSSRSNYLSPIPDLPPTHYENLASPTGQASLHLQSQQSPNIYGYQNTQSPTRHTSPQQQQYFQPGFSYGSNPGIAAPQDIFAERQARYTQGIGIGIASPPAAQEVVYGDTIHQSQGLGGQHQRRDSYQYNFLGAGASASSGGQVQYDDQNRGDMSSRKRAAKVEEGGEKKLGPSMGIEVKTKFPVARIKRIMQADEEVGKVAQVTPVAVSKALELFMISLITKSATVARSTSSKRVTAQHLKRAIEADEQFDFLNEIVAKVPDLASGDAAGGAGGSRGKRVKSEEGSSDEGGGSGGGGGAGKKRAGGGRGRGRGRGRGVGRE